MSLQIVHVLLEEELNKLRFRSDLNVKLHVILCTLYLKINKICLNKKNRAIFSWINRCLQKKKTIVSKQSSQTSEEHECYVRKSELVLLVTIAWIAFNADFIYKYRFDKNMELIYKNIITDIITLGFAYLIGASWRHTVFKMAAPI